MSWIQGTAQIAAEICSKGFPLVLPVKQVGFLSELDFVDSSDGTNGTGDVEKGMTVGLQWGRYVRPP
jgi:hypothetical protein